MILNKIRDTKVLKGILFVIIGFILYAVMDAIVKDLSDEFSLSEIIFFNALFALFPILVMAFKLDGAKCLKTTNVKLHLTRGLIMFGATFAAFYGYSQMPLAEAYAIAFSVPFFIAIFSVIFLKEVVGLKRWVAVVVGFIGVMLILKPGPDHVFSYAAFGPLGAAIGISFGIIIVRYLGRTESSLSIAFYSNFVILCVAGLTSLHQFVIPSLVDFMRLSVAGLLCGFADLFIFSAYKRVEGAILAPFQYTQILWGAIVGYLAFGDVPNEDLLIGGSVVIVSGLYIIISEAKLERRRKKRASQADVMLVEDR